MTDEDMEQLDLLSAVTFHCVSLSPLDLPPPAHTFSSNAQLTLTTQQENLGAQRLHISAILQVHVHTNSYL